MEDDAFNESCFFIVEGVADVSIVLCFSATLDGVEGLEDVGDATGIVSNEEAGVTGE